MVMSLWPTFLAHPVGDGETLLELGDFHASVSSTDDLC